jgi:ribosome-binding factor A
MRFHRKERIESVIERELSRIINKEVEFAAGALVTITGVAVSGDREHAAVRISVLPAEKAAQCVELLTGRQPYLQALLLRRMNIRPMPRIRFEEDKGQLHAAEVEKKLIESDNS